MPHPTSYLPAVILGTIPATRSVWIVLLPISLSVFISFLALGAVMPVLPLHIHNALGMSSLVVGIVAGAQFAAALLSRAWAGGIVDAKGSKTSVVRGLLASSLAGGCYVISTYSATHALALYTLLAARVLQGCGESLIVTGALSWGVGLVGPGRAGKVMAWVGIAIYGAYALGAPLGVQVHGSYGFRGIAILCGVLPLMAWVLVATLTSPAPPSATQRIPFYKVLGHVWLPGLGLALSSVGFGLLTAFVSLLFAQYAWGSASLMFTAFGVAFIGARLLFGHLPDQIGGAKVALVSVLIEALGQLLIWLSLSPQLAYVGAALTGFGYSLAFPSFGVEAVKRAPAHSRGAAMGAYVAFLDISLGVVSPAAGALAKSYGVDSVYLAGALAVISSTLVAMRLITASRISTPVKTEENQQ